MDFPSGEIKNLVKFHLTVPPSKLLEFSFKNLSLFYTKNEKMQEVAILDNLEKITKLLKKWNFSKLL